MTAHHLSVRFRYGLRHSAPGQIVFLGLIWLFSQEVVRATGLPLTGGIVGLALVLLLLATRRISVLSLRRGASWFLAELLLFFIPAVLAVLNYPQLFGLLGLKIMVVILGGTVAVMGVTAMTVELSGKWRARHAASHALDA
ncbi:CidA/LrgA family protein [Acidimangrovimonas sediminis]|uniref:CidA/LrgA family protein n=1 Tax=Acidimangrovimonas sediminis TaxID=2056283 RepID=UPI000C8024A6|nr:CidA/LrgA family protein [Acidimangrovimonas sediminis]